jgi:hypothetical protein
LPELTFHGFIASRIYLHCPNALTKKILTHRSDEEMNSVGNFPKIHYFRSFHSKVEKHHRLCLYICGGKFCPVYGNFCMDLYSVDSDEALNASLLQFLSSVKNFIGSMLQFFSQR